MSTQLIDNTWLDALEILKDHLEQSSVVGLYTHTRFEPMKEITHKAHFFRYVSARRLITHFINPSILYLPRIERVEFFLSFGLESWKVFHDVRWDEFRLMCQRVGTDYSNTPNPRERWRWICALPGAEKFSIWNLEDRPRCEYCTRPMPTGSACHPTRSDVHENCGYELDAIMEALRQKKLEVA